MAKERVTILGGGLSGLVTAYNLTVPEQAGRYDVTVYQHGWRLGGKCATGRNADKGNCIEEHGLHVFMGQYDNAFHMLRSLYAEMQTPPFATWQDAFTQQPSTTLMEHVKDDWIPWQVDAPVFPGTPGDPNPPTIWERMIQMLEWIEHQMFHTHRTTFAQAGRHIPDPKAPWIARAVHGLLQAIGLLGLSGGFEAVKSAIALIDALPDHHKDHSHANHHEIADALDSLRQWIAKLIAGILDDNNTLRRLWIMFDLMLTNAIGGLRDGLLFDPDTHLDAVNKLDYKEWMRKHGGSEIMVESAIIRGLYDLIFAYSEGDWTSDGNTEAGTMFLSLMNTSRYRGSLIWKFNTATGEMVIAPLYEVLKKRGVKFAFFSRVDELTPSASGNWISEVKIGQQVRLKDGTYNPLRTLDNGHVVWPNQPLYDQIKDGAKLKKSGANLESRWTKWKDTGKPLTLKMGVDYDWLVLAIPPGAHPVICAKLMAQNAAWNTMVNKIETTATQSLQIWQDKTVAELGWNKSTMVGAYDQTGLNTWSDISEVLPRETWPASTHVKSEIIACGPLPCGKFPPPATQTDFPAEAQAAVVESANKFLNQDGWRFWPEAFKPGQAGPLINVYNRANVDPSERYTLTVKDSTRFRFMTNGSGYSNLFLTGDWIQNGQNQGSFEATTISGKLASKAISGYPETIFRIDADKYIATTPMMAKPPVTATFVDHEGIVTFPGPVDLAQSTMWTFLVEADRSKLEAFCKQTFTDPSGGAVKVLPLASHMMVSIMDAKRGSYADLPERGWSPERELAFWVPVVQVEEKSGEFYATAFNFAIPYLALDNPGAIAAGREIFGYWKQRGWLSLPSETGNGFEIDLFASKTFGVDVEEKRQRFVTLTKKSEHPSAKLAKVKTFKDAVKLFHTHMEPEFTKWHPTLKFDLNLLGNVLTGHIPQLFLKQFRDISDGTNACYQAITEATGHVNNFSTLPSLFEYDMVIEDLASSPVASQFGITPQQTVLGVELTLDLHVPPGKVLWQA